MRGARATAALFALALAACGGEGSGGAGQGAGKEAPPQKRPGEREIAAGLELLAKEAQAALDAGDAREAGRLVGRGLAEAAAGGEAREAAKGRFLRIRGDLARDEGRTIDARRDYADAMAIFRVEGVDPGRFEVFVSQAQLEEIQGDTAAAERELAEAATLLPRVGDDALRGAYHRQVGRLAFVHARYPEACAAYAEAAKSFSSAKERRQHAETLLLLAVAQDEGGDAPLARRTLDKSLATFVELGDKGGEVRALHRLARFAERDGQTGKARTLLTKVLALYEELGRRSDAAKVARHLESLPEGTR